MNVKKLSTSACETIYEIDGLRVSLWIITGGTPALGIQYTPYYQRFPCLEKYDDQKGKWLRDERRYIHQDPNNIIGPTPEEVLPEGWTTVENFVKENFPKYHLAKERVKNLPRRLPIYSRRAHDKEEHTYVIAHIGENSEFHTPVVTFSSARYAGRCMEKITLLDPWWKKMQDLCNYIESQNIHLWSDLAEKDYQALCELLSKADHNIAPKF